LLGVLEDLSRKRPVLMIFEDVQWIDPTSRELLDLTIERIRRLPVLLIITFRPEFQEAWSRAAHVSALPLNRLDADEGSVPAESIAGKALPDEVLTHIAARADGVPLFVEELTRAVVESGLLRDAGDRYALDRPIPSFAIPPSLHASLLARLDRLGTTAKEIAQIGAAIGRDFSYEPLAAVVQRDETELQDILSRLVDAGLVLQRGLPPDANFLFKHALVQDAAYGTLLRGPRQGLHALIADALQTRFPEIADSQPELLAQHYAEAGLIEKSVAYWGKAGRRSATRSAMAEAAAQFQRALDQLALLPDSTERQWNELELRSAVGAVLNAVKGFAAPETGVAYASARALWEQLGSPLEFLQIPYGQAVYHRFRGELELAQRLDEELLRLSLQRDDSGGLILGHLSAAHSLMALGSFASSRSHLEELLAVYDPVSHRSLVNHAGFYPHVTAQVILGTVLFCLGFPDQALARSNAAIAEAQRLAHPPSLVLSLANNIMLRSLIGYDAALGDQSERVVAVAREQGFPYWAAIGTMLCGWAKVTKGDLTEGTSLLHRGLTAYRATGAKLWSPYHDLLLAGACDIAGQISKAIIPAGRCFAGRRKNRRAHICSGAEQAQGPVAAPPGTYRRCRGAVS
jgi:predicted ATPase